MEARRLSLSEIYIGDLYWGLITITTPCLLLRQARYMHTYIPIHTYIKDPWVACQHSGVMLDKERSVIVMNDLLYL